jgi:CHASE2 domain-containing sensor protein
MIDGKAGGTSNTCTMNHLQTRLLFAGRMLTAVLGISLLLLIVGRELFPIISPAEFLLCAGVGALLLIAVVHFQPGTRGRRDLLQPRSAAQGK